MTLDCLQLVYQWAKISTLALIGLLALQFLFYPSISIPILHIRTTLASSLSAKFNYKDAMALSHFTSLRSNGYFFEPAKHALRPPLNDSSLLKKSEITLITPSDRVDWIIAKRLQL